MLSISLEHKTEKKMLDLSKLPAALEVAAIEVQNEAKALCPVDTGTLRESIVRSVIVRSVEDNTAIVGTNVEYAPYVEYGTSRQQPQSFIRAGLDTARARAIEAFRKIFFGG